MQTLDTVGSKGCMGSSIVVVDMVGLKETSGIEPHHCCCCCNNRQRVETRELINTICLEVRGTRKTTMAIKTRTQLLCTATTESPVDASA